MFLRYSCKETAVSKSVNKFFPKLISDEIMCRPVSEILHTSTHLQQKNKVSQSLYYLGHTHYIRWNTNYQTNRDLLEFLCCIQWGQSHYIQILTICSISHKSFFIKQVYQNSKSKQSTNFDVKSIANGVNIYRSIQLCTWINNWTKYNRRCYNSCTKVYIHTVQLARLQMFQSE